MGTGRERRVILVRKGSDEVNIPLRGKADYICVLHEWRQLPEDVRQEEPLEGLVVAQYELTGSSGARHVLPVRGRFEVPMVESPGPPWLAMPFHMWQAVDFTNHPPEIAWGRAQHGVSAARGLPFVCALPNPEPDGSVRSLTIRGFRASPLLVAAVTLYRGAFHPLRHLPRRTYRITAAGSAPVVQAAAVDLGGLVRLEETAGPRGKRWLSSPHAGLNRAEEPAKDREGLLELFGAEDATVSVKIEGMRRRLEFSLGEAFHSGQSRDPSGKASLHVLDKARHWMRVVVRDGSTGKPTPVRIHLSGPRGEYIAPYGHHAQINARWFEDYGADVVAGGRQYAYVPGEFATDLPVGDLYVEICKGFEYEPVRSRVTIRPGQQVLNLSINRKLDWRSRHWVTADTHVHFISPHTAWLEGQAEGVNVVNLLASQWGRLFTNVGDYVGGPNVVADDTIVYVGTENRNHMLGHMSMLGTKGLPVYPMCCGGPMESFLGDPDFVSMAEWALENRRKGGIVIRPHFPFCGFSEDPVPILKGLVDALEVRVQPEDDFATQEWYRYLNCGCRVAVVGGTDKMSASSPIGWLRTYALLDPARPFDYENWADSVRAGRTLSTTGPLVDLTVEGKGIGDTIQLPRSGGTLEVEARAECVWPIGRIDIVQDGRVVAAERAPGGARSLRVRAAARIARSGWIAARCSGWERHPAAYMAAHTSPVYVKCGETRAFDGPAAQHMLALVEASIEYIEKLATAFDEASRRRMINLFKEVQADLRGRLRSQ
jgi:hypothetical protein